MIHWAFCNLKQVAGELSYATGPIESDPGDVVEMVERIVDEVDRE
jgi:hypothetical protein